MVSIDINDAFEQTGLLLPEPTESLDMLGELVINSQISLRFGFGSLIE